VYHKPQLISGFAISFFLLVPKLIAADAIQVRIALFRGSWAEAPAQRPEVTVLSAFTNPKLSILKNQIAASGKELRTAVIEALMERGDLKEIDDLFVMDREWNGETPGIWDSVLGRESAYRIGMLLKKQDSGTISVHAAVKQTKEHVLREQKDRKIALRQAFEATRDDSRMEEIINEEILVRIDDPVIFMFPSKDGVDFLLIALTRKPVEKEPPEPEAIGHAELVPAPRAVREVQPLYPDDLKKEGIGGELKLRITIGKDGKVEGIFVTKSVHPYLDFAAVEAFKSWEFEPVVKKGRPVRAAFDYSYHFDPLGGPTKLTESIPAVAGYGEELDRILAGCAGYCRKVKDAALDFVCEESIDETHYRLNPDIRPADLWYTWSTVVAEYSDGRRLTVAVDVQVMDPNRTEHNSYVCDYQLVRRSGAIKERRIILKENGRQTPDRTRQLEEKRFSMLVPMTICLRILDHDHQPLYDFQIEGESGVSGKKTCVLEAVSKPANGEWIRKARIWVDRQNFQILKSEIDGVPIEGYEDVLSDCVHLNGLPDFRMTNEYGVEKNGVIFPEKTTVQVEYRGVGHLRPIPKLRMSLKYRKYKFFTVETDHEIIRQGLYSPSSLP
jgi:TonB family protein